MNIQFSYLYRDGANYKAWGAVVFSNPDNISLKRTGSDLRQAFEQEQLFIAHQLQLEELFHYNTTSITSDDHCYHEYNGVEPTNEKPSDHLNRSVTEFLEQVQLASVNWDVFDPSSRL